MHDKLTSEDINSIQYFWLVRGDLTRWCGWKDKRKAIERELPEVMKAYRKLKKARRRMYKLVKALDPDRHD